MKKSNALMLSYIIMLTLAMFADILSTWDGIDQVALAATMAGFFFAFADYYGWKASYNKPMIDAKIEYLNSYRLYLNEVLDMAKKDSAVVSEVAELLEPYRNSHESVMEVIEKNKELADIIERVKSEATASLEEFPDMMRESEKKEQEIHSYNFYEALWATIGFLVFFILIVFDIAEQIMPMGSITTVGAFCIIMLTYFSKDLHEAKAQKDVAKTKKLAHEMNIKLTTYKEELHKTNLLEKAKKMISDIEKYLSKEEEIDNG